MARLEIDSIRLAIGENEILNAIVTLAYIKGKGGVMKSHPLPEHVKSVMQDYMK